MPELDYALLADYVRVDVAGVAHVIAGGVDTVYAREVPTGHNLGLLMRVTFTQGECGRPHRVEVFFRDTDGKELARIEGVSTPEWNENLPAGWKVGTLIGLNFGVPLPAYGVYAFEIMVNDDWKKTLDLRVVQQSPES